MPGTEKANKNTMICVTCDHWSGGERELVTFTEVEYEVFQRARCMHPSRAIAQTTPLFRCNSWKLWSKLTQGGGGSSSTFDRHSRSASRQDQEREKTHDRARIDEVLNRAKRHISGQNEAPKTTRGSKYQIIEPDK